MASECSHIPEINLRLRSGITMQRDIDFLLFTEQVALGIERLAMLVNAVLG
jgi:hypothetical protein